MNWSKNLYILMLSMVIVLSGCFGTGTTDGEGDADTSGTTVINNYYNNTTNIHFTNKNNANNNNNNYSNANWLSTNPL